MGKAQGKHSYETGVAAEELAGNYLRLKGYKILEKRYKTPVGEIDLIALKGDLLAFVEVKARKTEEEALYAVGAKARRRIEAAAMQYISENEDYIDFGMRFDVITVPSKSAHNLLAAISIQHLDNAWIAGE